MIVKTIIQTIAIAFGLAATGAQGGTPYPTRPVTLVVPFAPGGTTDVVARIMADHMSRTLGQQLIVENVVGAGGTIGSARVAKAAPDGYMLMVGNLGTHAASIGLYPRLPYDPRTDFEPIMSVAATPMLVVAKKDLPVRDFKEFISYLKENQTKVNYGTGGIGTTGHLTCLFLDALLGVKPQHVPFRGSGPALNALLGGQVDYVCDQTVSVVPSIQANQVKGLVVATPNRISVVPDVPTAAEQDLPQFAATGWNALFAPKGVPSEIIVKLNAAAKAALNDENTRRRFLELGADLPNDAGQTPQALAELVRAEVDKWVPIIKGAGVLAP